LVRYTVVCAAGDITLIIGPAPSPPEKRYFAVMVTTPTGGSSSREWLAAGTKSELLAKLRAPDMVSRVVQSIEEGVLGLRQHDLK
jgi:hypothetical protein